MIELREIDFRYTAGDFALQIDHLSVAAGEQVCWVGPSGCGKTTLLHIAAGIFTAARGSVHACGKELSTLNDAARRDFRIANIGLVFQDFALLDYLSVLDNILLPYRISGALQLNTRVRDRARDIATNLDLGTKLARRPKELSQGERQRVAVCRSIITQPKLLLIDEPTANLDSQNATRVLEAIGDYATDSNATSVVVSHDRDTVARFESVRDISEFCRQRNTDPSQGMSHA